MNLYSDWTTFCREMWCTYWSSNVQHRSIHITEKQRTTCHNISNEKDERSEKGKSWVTTATAKMWANSTQTRTSILQATSDIITNHCSAG